jgi:hypothetical protein
VRVLEQKPLIVFIVLPADVTGMVVAQQDVPLLSRLVEPADLTGPSVDNARSLGPSAKRIGPGIERVMQDLHDAVVGRRLPDQLVDVDVAQNDGHLEIGRSQPQEHLPRAAQLTELGKDEPHHFDYMFVRIGLDLAGFVPAKPRRQHEAIFPAARLGVAGGNTALSQQTQLVFRHRALQPEQQAIVDESRIIGSVRVDHQRAGERAQVNQVMPVAPVARQTRGLDAVNRAHIARTDHSHEPLKPGPMAAPRPGAPKVVVNHGYRNEAGFLRCSREIILAALAFQVAHDLRHGRLADVDDGSAA